MKNENELPINQKLNLTVKEAAEYSNIGVNRLTYLLSLPNCPFLLSVGNKKLVKRQVFEEYINSDELHYI